MSLPRRRFLTQLLAWPLVAMPAALHAQVGRRYRIELVIFEHLGAESREFIEHAARPLKSSPADHTVGEGTVRQSARGFDLHHVADRIERSGQGRVIARLAWDQVGRNFQSTPWVRVQEGRYLGTRTPAPEDGAWRTGGLVFITTEHERYELEGRLRVWVGHFLHLETDLVYHVPHSPGADPDAFPALPVRGSQRMNSGPDLFYLDHPVVGIIARVTRIGN